MKHIINGMIIDPKNDWWVKLVAIGTVVFAVTVGILIYLNT